MCAIASIILAGYALQSGVGEALGPAGEAADGAVECWAVKISTQEYTIYSGD